MLFNIVAVSFIVGGNQRKPPTCRTYIRYLRSYSYKYTFYSKSEVPYKYYIVGKQAMSKRLNIITLLRGCCDCAVPFKK